ncbi:MAG: MFS transporter [Phycisphaerae bacterium]
MPDQGPSTNDKLLFLGCWIALVATAFGFVIRTMIINDWGTDFGLSETQKGEIFGVGLWPFAISIILFSLVVDRIGYGNAMIFAFVCHVSSAIITITAKGYWSLYIGTFIVALGNGTVEAVINPVVATMFTREKTKWLNILHAGWPGGMVLGGLLTIGMGAGASWKMKVGLILIPTLLYGLLLLGRRFPVHERVLAGVSYKDMLKEVGAIGAALASGLVVWEMGRVIESRLWEAESVPGWFLWVKIAAIGLITVGYGGYVQSLGRPLFIFLLLIMIPLATTELGTDSWITPLMETQMKAMGLNAGWLLVYTATIMTILRLFAGPIVHKLSPLGLLAVCAAIAACGLVFLSKATGVTILVAATLYGFGKTFFWPTMLGIVAERFPKGGAMTLNTIAGVGMLSVGTIGTALMGNIQDKTIDQTLASDHAALHAKVVADQAKMSVFGPYRPIDQAKVAALTESEKATVKDVQESAKKSALARVAILPVIMLVCYLILIVYFRAQGGYKAEVLAGHGAEDKKFTGGVEGPTEA